jgi:hypothetical protein
MAFDTVELDGKITPFHAVPQHSAKLKETGSGLVDRGHPIYLRPRSQSPSIGTFVFFSGAKRYVISKEYEMKWVTAGN